MPRIIVLPTQEDQFLFDSGREPENWFVRDFTEQAECEAYVQGLETMSDLVEHEILEDEGNRLVIDLDGDRLDLAFETAGRKAAYVQGLEDGDGFVAAKAYAENDLDFERLASLEIPSAPSAG